jgi:heavy metal sensor kinase
MIFNSIKWRLQIWYGLILVAVLVGFGVTAYQLERGRVFGRIDNEIHRRISALAQQLHRPPRGPRQDRPPGGPEVLDAREMTTQANRVDTAGAPDRPDGPPSDQFPGDGPPDRGPRPLKFVLTPQLAALFDTNNYYAGTFYFIIEGRDGKIIAHSDNVDGFFTLEQKNEGEPVNSPPEMGERAAFLPSRTFGPLHELSERLPSGEVIRVGCRIGPELGELGKEALLLAGVGAAVLFIGLLGGWWFVGRALRPVSEISATAAKISAGDLSQRINVAETESELGGLATVLNSTFARLETTFAQQRQFTSDAAHELRTPVSVILTQAQSALNRERSPAEYRETLEACQRAAQRMRRLIASLLELARFDGGQEKLNRQRFDLAQMARDCVELVRPIADAREVKFQCELPPLECAGDAERLAQVVTNLLTNAIQHNPPGTEVRVTLAAQGNLAALAVADNGAGIPAEDLPRVFERFYQADKSRSSGGSGLGLAISKAVVEAHGGTLEVSSREGEGTTFTIRLPLG